MPRGVLIVGALVVCLALATIVVAAGRPGDDGQAQIRRADRERIDAPGLRVTAPAGWRRADGSAPIPGMPPSAGVSLVEKLSGVRLVVAQLLPSSAGLLPADLLDDLDAPPKRPERVLLGGRLWAYYYSDLSLRDAAGRLVVFAAPTTEGVATVACLGMPSSLEQCAEVANTLTLTRGTPISLGQDSAFRLGLDLVVRSVDSARETSRRELATARTPAEQARAALHVSDAYHRATNSLRPLAAESTALAPIVRQLRANAGAYARIAADLRRQQGSALERERARAVAGETRLKALLQEQD